MDVVVLIAFMMLLNAVIGLIIDHVQFVWYRQDVIQVYNSLHACK